MTPTRRAHLLALEAKATQGEWVTDPRISTRVYVRDEAHRGICSTGGYQRNTSDPTPENEANAELIAELRNAAPALLASDAALSEVRKLIEREQAKPAEKQKPRVELYATILALLTPTDEQD